MKTQVRVLFIFLLLAPAVLHAGSWEGKVVGVSDGDTIKVIKNGEQVKIRLASIDCPEKGQPQGQRAKQFTSDLVAGRIFNVWETDTDR